MKKKRIYIAGPMRGYKDLNYDEFMRVGLKFLNNPNLRDIWEPVNPIEIGVDFGGAAELENSPELLERLMEFELAAVKSCDAILLLSGWEKSAGARGELRVALDNDLEIYTQDKGDIFSEDVKK